MALNDTLDQMGLTDIFRTLHTKMTEYTFFLSTHGAFSRIDHILGHKSGLNRYPVEFYASGGKHYIIVLWFGRRKCCINFSSSSFSFWLFLLPRILCQIHGANHVQPKERLTLKAPESSPHPSLWNFELDTVLLQKPGTCHCTIMNNFLNWRNGITALSAQPEVAGCWHE